MKPAKLSTYYLIKGDTYTENLTFNYRDGDDIDLSGYTNIKQDIRKQNIYKSELLYSIELNSGITLQDTSEEGEDPESNTIKMVISNDITEGWKSGVYYRDIKFTDNQGNVKTWCTGKIQIIENITE